ncbi:hypothetical protein HMPREF0682_1130 [Propionibacterium acidifaciens F0233]|uniref:Uncharacterized protein n=1 Tax=Propionibacterium acidifaciens F0233 TaxID=553198 RepID=U2R4H5_9ACTN|nr:hypothetical protein HMPREF0682_1130 [Propionibacterium acidifaciens F0233]
MLGRVRVRTTSGRVYATTTRLTTPAAASQSPPGSACAGTAGSRRCGR